MKKIFVIDKDEITEEERLRSLIATQNMFIGGVQKKILKSKPDVLKECRSMW